MSAIRSFFGFGNSGGLPSSENAGIKPLYALSVPEGDFVSADVKSTYVKILTDVAERTHGLKDEQARLLWDSCLQSENADGIVTMLADAMLRKDELALIYKSSVNMVRKATREELEQIKSDYKSAGKSSLGVLISFARYDLTDMLKIYSSFEYCVLGSLNKSMNLAKAIQFKMSEMRKSVSLADEGIASAQAVAIAEALRAGKDVMIDKEDVVETAKPDTSPAKDAIAFLDSKRAFYLRMPIAYVTGLQTGGLGATGEADVRAAERGLSAFFKSIMQPVLEALFSVKVEYRSQDFRAIDAALNTIKTFDVIGDDLLSRETKQDIVARMMNVDPDAEREQVDAEREAAAEALRNAGGDVQKQAFNGAQISSMVDVVSQVAAGSLPRDSGVQIIMISFQVDQATAEKILGSAGRGFKPTATAPAKPAVPPPTDGGAAA